MRNRELIFSTLLVTVAVCAPAHAYIDPGSGSVIMSAIIGFIVAVSLAVKTYWYKIKSLFGAGQTKTSTDDADHESPSAKTEEQPKAPAEER